MGVEIQPSEELCGVLDEQRIELGSGELLCADMIRQHRLACLLREDDDGKLAGADLLPVFQDLNVLKILNRYPVKRDFPCRDLGPQPLLQFIAFRPRAAAGLMKALIPHESG